MNKYVIVVTELCDVHYVVEAKTKEEADKLFAKWANRHQEYISEDLLNSPGVWEYSKALECKDSRQPDILYKELIESDEQ